MAYVPTNPVIVQSDKTILLEVANPLYETARDALMGFAELEKSPEHVHTYRITPLSLWNAAAAGITAESILADLGRHSKFELPPNIRHEVVDQVGRYGRVRLIRQDDTLLLVSDEPHLIALIWNDRRARSYLLRQLDERTLEVRPDSRGHIKQALLLIGFPAQDLAGYVAGAPLSLRLRPHTRAGVPWALRSYQREAVAAFHAGGRPEGGSGAVVLPCGAGKTMVAMGVMAALGCQTLILTTSTAAVHQWIAELLDKTELRPDQIGEYTGDVKEIRPVTVSTYQILVHRRRTDEDFPHFRLFNAQDWGLIVYDEVHLLPAPVFRITAEIQARRRLGLTATLVREDGREGDVFTLIGPKKHDVPWKELEQQGWIATALCHEIRLPLPPDRRLEYALADARTKYRVAAENPEKLPVIRALVERHRDDQVLVIGQYLDQLKQVADYLQAPLITGQTPNEEREQLYAAFRRGVIPRLVVSKVANFSIDLPDANVAIQISGTFGSRQEEAQRLGRILRPKADGSLAYFYSLVTKETRDQDFAAKRQLFLTEQGYHYVIGDGLDGIEEAADWPPVVRGKEAVAGV